MNEVCLLGFAQSTQGPAWELPKSVPIWSLNNAFMKGFPRLDAVFDPHPIEHIKHPAYIKGRPTHDRIEWLRTNTEIPVYMQKAYKEVPMAVRYPIEEVIQLLGDKEDLTSTFALMMAYAILQEPKRIYVYGFNMGVEYEYRYQLPGGRAMIRFAKARGIDVVGPPESLLFRPTKVYGYEGSAMIGRRTLEKAQQAYQVQVDQNDAEFHRWQGVLNERTKGYVNKHGRLMGNHQAVQEAQQKMAQYQMQSFAAKSCVDALQKLIDEADLIETEPVKIEVKKILRGK